MDSRESKEADSIRRRRECERCNRRFTTYERIDEIPYMVVKKDGRRERFDRQKVLSGLLRACEKRPVSSSQLEADCGCDGELSGGCAGAGTDDRRGGRADYEALRAWTRWPTSALPRFTATSKTCANSRKNWKGCWTRAASRGKKLRTEGQCLRFQGLMLFRSHGVRIRNLRRVGDCQALNPLRKNTADLTLRNHPPAKAGLGHPIPALSKRIRPTFCSLKALRFPTLARRPSRRGRPGRALSRTDQSFQSITARC